jgi:hypothetical protein
MITAFRASLGREDMNGRIGAVIAYFSLLYPTRQFADA